MKLSKIIVWIMLLLASSCSFGQVIDNTSSYRDMGTRYFRLHYDNDYFTKTDEYYTQGINLEIVAPSLKKWPSSQLLYHPPANNTRFGLSIDHYAYTPRSIRSDSILFGDRPFSANISLKLFAISTDSIRQQRISTSIIVGLIGPGAGGKEMQTSIHRWLKNVLPHGWQYQISNDLILDYQIDYERRLWQPGRHLLINSAASARIGTHNDNAKIGFNFLAGNFIDPYHDSRDTRKFHYLFYGELQGGLIGYDATLQGGIFNRSSPYIILQNQVSRFTVQGNYGLVASFKNLYFEYCQSILSPEFRTGLSHRWGGIRFGLDF